jgi:hypothetical protein
MGWKWALPLIAVAAFLAIAPTIASGSAGGHDFIYHLATWLDAARTSGLGGWASGANFGFGEPRFIFYTPLPARLGSAVASLLPPDAVPGTYAFLVLMLAGAAMFPLARQWFPPAHAAMAAAFYTVSPYLLICIYHRSSFTELLADAFCPLLLLYAIRLGQTGEAIAPLAAVLAAIWISDLPAAVVAGYALALIILVLAVVHRSWAPLWRGAAAGALGLALAAFFVLPAAYEQRWVDITPARQRFYMPHFWRWAYDPGNGLWFWAVISGLLCGMIALSVTAIGFSWSWRRQQRVPWLVMVTLIGTSIFMLLPFSYVFWVHLPELRLVQFPWRCMPELTACTTILLVAAMARFPVRLLMIVLGAIAFVAGLACVSTAHWYPGEARILEQQNARNHGYEGDPQYMPHNARKEVFTALREMPLVASSNRNTTGQIMLWQPQSKAIMIDSPTPAQLTLHLMNYPAWQVTINGNPVASQSDKYGRLAVPIPAGTSTVEARFVITPDRKLGAAISVIALLILAGLFIARRRERVLPPLRTIARPA